MKGGPFCYENEGSGEGFCLGFDMLICLEATQGGTKFSPKIEYKYMKILF